MNSFLNSSVGFSNKVILITGGTGSLGWHLVKEITQQRHPKKLIVFSRDELKQYEMSLKFPKKDFPFISYVTADIKDYPILEMHLRGVDIVIHAAAVKHLSITEENPYECFQTNVIGSDNIIRASIKNNVEKVLGISTDKAVYPVSFYGASKLSMEKIFLAANNSFNNDYTKISVARYGNILGSSGSVLPLFRRLLLEKAPFFPITDEKMTRFCITPTEGAHFLLSSLNMMQGNEIFIPKLPTMFITDLAKALSPTLPLQNIGRKACEKVHEHLLTEDESLNTLESKDCYIVIPSYNKKIYGDDFLKVKEPTAYASNTNKHILNVSQIQEMIHANEQ